MEINPREHFAAEHITTLPFSMESRWFSGSADITAVTLEWLLAGKLRALYGRRKGRDLYDLWLALTTGKIQGHQVVASFLEHLQHATPKVSRAEFEQNMFYKLEDPVFNADLATILATDSKTFDFRDAYALVHREIISKLPGAAWKGLEENREVTGSQVRKGKLRKNTGRGKVAR